MRTLLRHAILLLTLMVIAPAVGYTGPADDANAVIDQWAATYTANNADALVKLYAPNEILLGTVSPDIASGIPLIFRPTTGKWQQSRHRRTAHDCRGRQCSCWRWFLRFHDRA